MEVNPETHDVKIGGIINDPRPASVVSRKMKWVMLLTVCLNAFVATAWYVFRESAKPAVIEPLADKPLDVTYTRNDVEALLTQNPIPDVEATYTVDALEAILNDPIPDTGETEYTNEDLQAILEPTTP